MPAPTLYTNINLITSIGGYLANKFTESNWKVYWQSRQIFSGTGTAGEITIVPEFPNEPAYLVLPPRDRTQNEVLLPAFSIRLSVQPFEEERAGLGEDLFQQRVEFHIEGFAATLGQQMAFATMFRNWFRDSTTVPIWDWEGNTTTPELVDNTNTYVENRQVEAVELTNLPSSARYYISMICDLVFWD